MGCYARCESAAGRSHGGLENCSVSGNCVPHFQHFTELAWQARAANMAAMGLLGSTHWGLFQTINLAKAAACRICPVRILHVICLSGAP